jgi:hypothetical protein
LSNANIWQKLIFGKSKLGAYLAHIWHIQWSQYLAKNNIWREKNTWTGGHKPRCRSWGAKRT